MTVLQAPGYSFPSFMLGVLCCLGLTLLCYTHSKNEIQFPLQRRKCRSRTIIIANKVTNLIEARVVQVFGFFRERKLDRQTCMDRLLERSLCTKKDKYTKGSGP